MKFSKMQLVRGLTMSVFLVAFGLGITSAEAKTVGVFVDRRSGNLSGVMAAMTNGGWRVETIGAPQLQDAKALAKYDVLFFAGGFNVYYWSGSSSCAPVRRALTRYVARGGGIVLCGFRGGFVRNATRPTFPQIGVASCRMSSGWIAPVGDSVLAKAFGGKMISFSAGDHLRVEVGPAGHSFCGVDGMSCGAYGEVGRGRVAVIGAHFSYGKDEEGSAPQSSFLQVCLDWAAGGEKGGDEAEIGRIADREEAALCRRERMYDLTLEGRGPDETGGTIPRARDWVTTEPEALAYKLEYQAQFLSDREAKRARETSAQLQAAAAEVNAAAKALKAKAEAELERLDLSELLAFKQGEYAYNSLVSNLSARVDAKLVADAKAQAEKNAPVVAAVKLERVRKELAEDAKLVPGLIADLGSSSEAKRRYEAAMELGRIVVEPEAKVVAALVKALDDTDAQVRSQAAISLGWMQAKDAVAALMKKVDGADRRLANRAVQALGQIGDERAVPVLIKALRRPRDFGDARDSDDSFRALAVVALGQLKSQEAVPALREIARTGKFAGQEIEMAVREGAILALGYIGDESVVADLDALMKEFDKDRPRGAKRVVFRNPYSFSTHNTSTGWFGYALTAEMAKQLVLAGGRQERGVRQNPLFRAKDYFYRITGNCNALAGRVETGMWAFEGRNTLLPAHLWEAGATGVHNAWGSPGMDPAVYWRFLHELSEFDMCFVDVFSGYEGRTPVTETETRLEAAKDETALQGFWAEESWPEFGMGVKDFLTLSERRHGPNWKDRLTEAERKCLDDLVAKNGYIDFTILCKPADGKFENTAERSYHEPWDAGLRTLVLEAHADTLARTWTESQDYLKARRMGCAHTYVVSTGDPGRFIGVNPAFNAVDSSGLESYQSFGRSTSYWMQRYRDGNARSSMSELYNWYCPSVEHARRGFWQNAVHGKCFYNFALMEIFKHPSGNFLWRWEEGRWDAFREVFRRVRDNRECYRIRPSAAKTAVVFSERSATIVRNNNGYEQCAVPQRADQNAMALWVSLGQSHVQADVIYADHLTAEKLRKYAVLVLSDAKYLADAEIAVLREWVRAGGVLVAEGVATLFDGFTAKRRDNYALADVFGADYVRTDYLADDESDTYCRRRADPRAQFKFVTGLEGAEYRFHSEDTIHRDRKPVKSVRRLTADGGLTAEIDAAIGIDRVKPTTAKVIAKFEDGQPAILENAFGQGKCYFQCSAYPAMGHTTGEWEMMPNRWDFWTGNRELLERLVRDGLAFAKCEQAVEAKGLSGDVEVTVDDHGDKYVVHLLDYNVRNAKVTGGRLAVPGTRPIKRVYYPDTQTEVRFDGREFALRDFSAYDMAVVEFAQ